MTDTIRCPGCRGAKKVPKLGGMIGYCNMCGGKGTILAEDKPKPVIAEPVESVNAVIGQVANVAPVSDKVVRAAIIEELAGDMKTQPEIQMKIIEEPQIKVDRKKRMYRRKKA